MAHDRSKTMVTLKHCTVSITQRMVYWPGELRSLTQKEAELLGYLVAHTDQTISRATLHREVWGYRSEINSRMVDIALHRLRSKLELDPARPQHLHTHRGEGYRFTLEPRAAAAPQSSPAAPLLGLGARRPRIPLVGREAELVSLRDVWSQSLREGAQLILLEGERGIGKSRLAQELQWEVQACPNAGDSSAPARVTVRTLFCPDLEDELAMVTLTTLLRELPLGELEPLWRMELTRLLPELDLAQEHRTLLPSSPASWQRMRLFDAISRAIDSTLPALLIIEDIQWADAESLSSLRYLLQRLQKRPLCLVVTLRSELRQSSALCAFLDTAQRLQRLHRIRLARLGPQASAELVSVCCGPLLEEVSARLYSRSEGHPLFLLELLRTDGLQAEAGSLPPSLVDTIQLRLACLSPEARALAELCALAREGLSYSVLEVALRIDTESLLTTATELEANAILRETSGGVLLFCHQLYAEVLEQSLQPTARRLGHLRLAQALAVGLGHRRRAGRIAYHTLGAGLEAQAIPHLLDAAREAEALCIYTEALSHYQRAWIAIERAEVSDPAVRWNVLLGRIVLQARLGQNGAVREAIPALEACAAVDPCRRARVLILRSQLETQELNLSSAQTFLHEALRLARLADDASLQVEALHELARCLYLGPQSAYVDAAHMLEEGLRIGINSRLELACVHLHKELAGVLAHLGRIEDASHQISLAQTKAQALKDRTLELEVQLYQLGVVHRAQAYAQAMILGECLLRQARELQQLPVEGASHLWLGHTELRLRNFRQSRLSFAAAIEIAETCQDALAEAEAHLGLGKTLFQLGLLEMSEEHLHRALLAYSRAGMGEATWVSTFYLAELEARSSRQAAARVRLSALPQTARAPFLLGHALIEALCLRADECWSDVLTVCERALARPHLGSPDAHILTQELLVLHAEAVLKRSGPSAALARLEALPRLGLTDPTLLRWPHLLEWLWLSAALELGQDSLIARHRQAYQQWISTTLEQLDDGEERQAFLKAFVPDFVPIGAGELDQRPDPAGKT